MAYKVLVVDDESSNLHVMRTILQEHYTLVFAKNGERAIELTLKQRPDLILLDIMMPGMNGYEVCKRLKNEPSVQHIPIVIVSALDEYKSEVEGLKVGASDFLIKPVSAELVKSRVANLLGEARASMMKENFQFVMDKIALMAGVHHQKLASPLPRTGAVCEWLALKYGLTKVKAEDLHLAYPLCMLGALVDDPNNNTSIESRTLSLFSQARNGFTALVTTLLTYKNARWDGLGLPAIAGEDIPEESRITAVVELLNITLLNNLLLSKNKAHLNENIAFSKGQENLKITMLEAIDVISQKSGKEIEPRLVFLLEKNIDELCDLYHENGVIFQEKAIFSIT